MVHPKILAIAPIDVYWAIEQQSASKILAQIEESPVESRESSKASLGQYGYQIFDRIAVMEIEGVMTKKPNSMQALIGGTSTIQARRSLQLALRDKDVDSILLVFDSPGGQVSGLDDFATEVAEANRIKPVTAYVEDCCGSAAYYVASQASAIYSNPSGQTGSIGCVAVVSDMSERAKQMGIKVHTISTGGMKGEGAPGTKLSKDYLDYIQSKVDGYGEMFFGAVARGRGMPMEEVMELANGKMWMADEALELGLIDGICSSDKLLTMIKSGQKSDLGYAATIGDLGGNPQMAHQSKLASFISGLKTLIAKHDADPDAATEDEQTVATTRKTPALAQVTPIQMEEAKLESVPNQDLENLNNKYADLEKSHQNLVMGYAQKYAERFAHEAVVAGKAFPVEEKELSTVFLNALKADGGGQFKVEEGKVFEGDSVKVVRSMIDARPSHRLFGEQIVHSTDEGKPIADGTLVKIETDGVANTGKAKLRASYLGATPTGVQILESMEGQKN